MAGSTLTLSLDISTADQILSSLTDAADRFPEFGEALVDALEAGEEFFLLKSDDGSAAGAGELVVRLYPSDALLGLMSAFRARYSDFCLFKHPYVPSATEDCSTMPGGAQCSPR